MTAPDSAPGANRYVMNTTISPVPLPALDAVAPAVHREVYGMPMFPTVPTADLSASVDFWVHGLGFIDLFSVPDRLTHLRRWTFQDVLLVPGEPAPAPTAIAVSFACVPDQLERIATACETFAPGCTDGPTHQPWNSLELRVRTPENLLVTMTAALPLNPDSVHAQNLREMGIDVPDR